MSELVAFQVADWLMEICEDQQAQPEVFCLAMNYLDRFLGIVRITQSQLQLLGAVCLLVAWKVRQHEPLPAARLVEYSDFNLNLIDIMVSWHSDTLFLDSQWLGDPKSIEESHEALFKGCLVLVRFQKQKLNWQETDSSFEQGKFIEQTWWKIWTWCGFIWTDRIKCYKIPFLHHIPTYNISNFHVNRSTRTGDI